MEDLEDLDKPVYLKTENMDVAIYDCLRVFSGDGPARQYEAGQQRGGNYTCLCGVKATSHTNLMSCYNMEVMTLDERCKLVVWKN